MADTEDLEALLAGEHDLVQADFRGADLQRAVLSNRDFTGAKFEKANLGKADFSNSILRGASFTQADLTEANLSRCNSPNTGFVHVKMSNANWQSAKLVSSNFHSCNLSGSDLRGADFSKANLVNDNNFEGTIVDENTKFDGAKILRPMIKNPAFRYYRLERGQLIRKLEGEIDEVFHDNPSAFQRDIENQIQTSALALDQLEKAISNNISIHGEIGHNGPPEDLELLDSDFSSAREALEILKIELVSPAPDLSKLDKAQKSATVIVNKVLTWASSKFELFSDELAKGAGKSLSSPTGLLAIALVFTGEWSTLIDLMVKFFTKT